MDRNIGPVLLLGGLNLVRMVRHDGLVRLQSFRPILIVLGLRLALCGCL